MSKNRNETQFEEYRDWQWIKHLILKEYAFLFPRILGKAYQHIVVVDTCAGAATYTDPDTAEVISEGSPVIFARAAKAYTEAKGPGKSMRVICCEKNRNNYKSLVEAVNQFEPHVKTLPGGFWRHVPMIADELGDSPALILLDPIGVATIPSHAWKPFLERKAKTDLFVVLHFAGVHRTGGWLLPNGEPNPSIAPARRGIENLDRVFNGRAWRDIALDPTLQGEEHREARERRYVQLFFDNVIGRRHRWKCYCEVRARHAGPIKYWLVHASDDFKPYTLMNDEIVKVSEILLSREYRAAGTLEGFCEAELEAHRGHIEQEMEKAVFEFLGESSGGSLPFGALNEKLLRRFFGRAKANVPWRVVKRLCKEDQLLREKTKNAAADDLERISLPKAGAVGDGASVVPIRKAA
jgi:three-Cys-motif partner protein